MNFNFMQTEAKTLKFPGFYKSNYYNLVVLAFDKSRGVVIEGNQYPIGYYKNGWRFEDTKQWIRISGKIELE